MIVAPKCVVGLCQLSSLNINTSLIDSPDLDLELDRQTILHTFCARDEEENWEDLFQGVPDTFVENINSYAKDNLVKLRVFISTPFATEYTRSIETTRSSFIANIGGNRNESIDLVNVTITHKYSPTCDV